MMTDYEKVQREAEEEERRREEKIDSAANYLDRVKRIKKEINRIKKLFSEIDENKKKLVMTTIEDVAFMTIVMQDLREVINRDGTVVEYKNGENQYGTKQSPEIQNYLQLSQKLTAAMKILTDCLQKTERVPKVVDDGFDSFVEERTDI